MAFAEQLEGEVLTLDYRPRWYFKPYHERKQRWACIVAHRRAGKTVATFRDLERAALADRRPDPLYAFIAPTYRQAKDNVWKYVERAAAEWSKFGAKINQSELSVKYPHGATVKLYGADNYDTLRGLRLCGAVLDEFADFDPRAWPTVIRPALADRRGFATIIGTPRGHNSFYQIAQRAQGFGDDGKFSDKLKEEWFFATLKASDLVPVNDKDPDALERDLLTSEELESIRRGLSEEEFLQEFECDFESAVLGAYYGKHMSAAEKEGRITVAPYDPAHQVWTAWDIGGNRDATAIWFAQLIGRQVVLIDFHQSVGSDSGPYAKVVLEKPYSYAQHFLPHDAGPSAKGIDKSYFDFLQDHGLRNVTVLPVQMVEHGINAARLLLPRCLFDKQKCYTGIEALKLYRSEWDHKLQGIKASPVHDWTCVTGDTAVLTRYGMRQIMNLPETGEVLTPCGWKPYRSPRITRKDAPLVEVLFTDGLSVRCTGEHLFLTADGWKFAADLQAGLRIQSCLTRSRSIGMAAYTAYGRMRDIIRAAVNDFILPFGPKSMGLYPAVAISTTATRIAPTTESRIWNACQWANTYRSLGVAGWKKAESIFSTKSPEQGRPTGTNQRPGAYGTNGTPSDLRAGQNGSAKIGRVWNAVRYLLASFAQTVINKSSVLNRARPLTIESVRPLPYRKDVWCLTVDDGGVWALANGAVTHNSHAADAFRYLAVALDRHVSKSSFNRKLNYPKLGKI